MPTRSRLATALVLCCIPLAACGGDDQRAASEPTAAQQRVAATEAAAQTPGKGGGQQAVADCANQRGGEFGLVAETDQRLVVDGLDESAYDVVAIDDQDGSIAQQALVFASGDAAKTGLEAIEANGFFDDVRRAGNTLVIRRGGDQPSTALVVECALEG